MKHFVFKNKKLKLQHTVFRNLHIKFEVSSLYDTGKPDGYGLIDSAIYVINIYVKIKLNDTCFKQDFECSCRVYTYIYC